MFSLSPRTTLFLLLGLAGVILLGGLRLARQEETVRIDRDRDALQRFAAEIPAELLRLEALYQDHLERVCRIAKPDDATEARRAAERIVGVRQYSLLSFYKSAPEGLHVQIMARPNERTPIPMFERSRLGGPGLPVLLPKEELFNYQGPSNGWLEIPGQPLMFWQRISTIEVVVLMIDPATVADAVDHWLSVWGAERFESVRVAGGPDQLRSHHGRVLLEEGNAGSARPDLILPVRSRLGVWEVASWDRRETRVHYQEGILAASVVMSLLAALVGFSTFGQQRRAAALAAQRVSFVNRVSHELRSPLTNILLNIDLASEAVADTPQEATRRLSLVQEEARRLGRLIDNVLTFSRQEQGKLRAEAHACVPGSVIAAVVEQFAPSLKRRALQVRCTGDLSAPCLLDADALAQILGNLLSNVEKYVPGGDVEIAGELTAGTLAMTVADQGPGIPLGAAERIFRPFERLDSRINEGASGTGLGLAIARDIASAMGGTLRLLPSARGACFELRVTAPKAPPLSAVSAA